MDLNQIWKAVVGELEVDLGKQNIGLYFKNSQLLSLDNGIAKLGFLNKAVALQASQRYYSLIQNSLQKISGHSPLSLIFDLADKVPATDTPQPATDDLGPLFETPKQDHNAIAEAVRRSGLRPDFILEEFCVSTSNQLAFAAAQAVIKDPGRNYSPFFIWGGVGIGKTHLMQAIGHEILRQNPSARVVYAPGEMFTNEIVSAIRNKNTSGFRAKYRTADALLIDDIQFIAGRDTTQEEFFHTFNEIQAHQGQIVMTSDRKPSDIKDLADRLRSRFEGGLVADISEPDHELKTAICILKAKKRGVELSTNLAEVIINNVDNIRTLEGDLSKLIQVATLRHQPVTEPLILEVLNRSVSQAPGALPKRLDGKQILDTVCTFYNIPLKLIRGQERDKPIVVPRQILMYLLKTNTGMTYEEIAAFLERKDHTTVIHGFKKIQSLLQSDQRLQSDIQQIHSRLGL